MKRIAVLFVLAAVLIGAQSAEATKPMMSTQKTSFTPTDVDTNGDGKTATVGSGAGTVKTGTLEGTTYSVAAFGEYEPLASVQSCPAGDSEFQLIDGWSVTRLSNGPSVFGDHRRPYFGLRLLRSEYAQGNLQRDG